MTSTTPTTIPGTRRALRVTVYVGEGDTVHHRPLYSEIVRRAHRAGLAGASVFRGIEGFGASSRVHTARLLSLSEDLPVTVVMVDAPARVQAFLPELAELLGGDGGDSAGGAGGEGLVTVEEIQVLPYGGPGTGPGTERGHLP